MSIINFKSILSHRTFVQQRQSIITDVADLKSVISLLSPPSPGEDFWVKLYRHIELNDYDKEYLDEAKICITYSRKVEGKNADYM